MANMRSRRPFAFGVLVVVICLLVLLLRPPPVTVSSAKQQPRLVNLVVPVSASTLTHIGVEALDYRRPYNLVYRPLNYSACRLGNPDHVQCWLQLAKPTDCAALFEEYIHVMKHHVPMFPPPKQVQPDAMDDYLLKGYTQSKDYYIAQVDYAPDAEVPVWTEAMFTVLLNKAKGRQQVGHYGNDCFSIYRALECHSIKGATGAVFGTEAPWLEAILFAFDVQHITTIEFRTTTSHIPSHRMLKPLDWAQEWKAGTLAPVDFAFSFSSWEHDGLGRYGDPLDPWGDVKAFARASCYVKPDGLLFFGAPTSSSDQLQYNAHRIYGFVRLPLVTANWEVLGVYEQDSQAGSCGMQTCHGIVQRWKHKAPIGHYGFQPVIVLRNRRTQPCQHHNMHL